MLPGQVYPPPLGINIHLSFPSVANDQFPDQTNLVEKWFVYLTHDFKLNSIIAGMLEQQELERARHSTTVNAER